MPKIEREDIIAIINVFNKGEEILDFSDTSFSSFTLNSIGLNLREEYLGTNIKVLELFYLDESKKTSDKVKLLKDLLAYYDRKEKEMFRTTLFVPAGNQAIKAIRLSNLRKCQDIIERFRVGTFVVNEEIKVEDGIDILLDEAEKYSKADIKVAVEKMWDTLERIKTFYVDSTKRIDKKKSCEKLIDFMSSGNSNLRVEIENEFLLLTKIGNDYRIRHHETTKIEITDDEHYRYLFNRCFSLIKLAIVTINKNK